MLRKVVILLTCTFLLTGCCKKPEKEIITFSSWGSITEVQILKKVLADFEKENPEIKVNFIHIPQNYFQKIHLLFASNTAPDVLFMNNLNLPIYASKLEDLTLEINKEDFFSQAISAMSYEDKILGIPRDISNLVLYVNLEKVPKINEKWTIEDFLKTSIEISQKDFFAIGCEEDVYWLTPYLTYFGGGILDENLNSIIDTQESKKAIDFYKNLTYKYKVAPTKSQIGSQTLAQMFLDEKIVMYLSGRWIYPKIQEKASFNWAVINFPYGVKPQLLDASGWVISKDSKHKNSAKKLIKYLSNEKTIEYFVNTGLIIPARIKNAEALKNKEHNEKLFIEILEYSTTTPVNKKYKTITDKINSKIFY
jgi:multiple sugar transport system substrate-binding protein